MEKSEEGPEKRDSDMNPDTPVLMITLQIPVTPETTTDQVLDAIGKKVSEMLYEFRQQQSEEATETISQEEFNQWVPKERSEPFTESTRKDLLEALGYASAE